MNNQNINTYNIIDGVKNQNKFYLEVYDLWHTHIVAGLISLANLLAPDAIIIGGSMSEFVDYDKLSLLIKDKAPCKVDLLKASLGNNAGIIGIAELAISE
jgi:predicted NBD/HSP70 family sugar kinase